MEPLAIGQNKFSKNKSITVFRGLEVREVPLISRRAPLPRPPQYITGFLFCSHPWSPQLLALLSALSPAAEGERKCRRGRERKRSKGREKVQDRERENAQQREREKAHAIYACSKKKASPR
jgi:hypothetical protein